MNRTLLVAALAACLLVIAVPSASAVTLRDQPVTECGVWVYVGPPPIYIVPYFHVFYDLSCVPVSVGGIVW